MAAPRSVARRIRRAVVQTLEPLESRCLLSALAVNGTAGDDIIAVTLSGTDVVATRGGEEVARAPLSATDGIVIDLGPGEDSAIVDAALTIPATITGGSGADTITGGAGNDVIDSGSEDDVVRGGAGDDRISTRSGADLVFGDGGKVGDAGELNAGDDTIDAGTESDVVYGGGGNDHVWGGTETDQLFGDYESIAPGSPLTSDGDDFLDAGDTLPAGAGTGSDTLVGDSGGATGGFRHGNDTLRSTGGDPDVIYGDTGPAASDGRPGDDLLLISNSTSGVLDGQGGDDTYRFFDPVVANTTAVIEVRESDAPVGGGRDTFDFSNFRAQSGMTVVVDIDLGAQGPHTITVNGGSRLMLWVQNPGAIEDVVGTPFGDRIRGNAKDNQLSGGPGDDVIDGGLGNDVLNGGTGRDELRGGDGDDLFLSADRQPDRLYGGAGNDTVRVSRLERATLDLTPDNDVEFTVDTTRRAPVRRGVLR